MSDRPAAHRGRRLGARLAASILVLASLGTALAQSPPEAGDLARVKASGKLRVVVYPLQDSHFVAVDLDVARKLGLTLRELHRAEQYKGIEIDLLKGFADSLGVTLDIEVQTTGIGDILTAVANRQADLAASGLMVTPERRKLVDFSAPYHSSWLAVVTRRDSKIRSLADLPGKRAAAIEGSSHLEFLRAEVPDARIDLTAFDLEGLNLVDQKRADFTLLGTNDPPGGPADPSLPNLKIAFRLARLDTGIALRKGSDLAAPLNAYLAAIRASGELGRILARYGAHEPDKG